MATAIGTAHRAHAGSPSGTTGRRLADRLCRRRELRLVDAASASRERAGVELAQVATRRSLSAVNAQRKFGFRDAGTDADAVFEDDPTSTLCSSSPGTARMPTSTCRALEAGKAVFVEKPLALTHDELDRILATVDATGNDRVMVGFNRRFSPLLVEMRARFGQSSEPTNARYLVNAGRLASDSWYRDNELEGFSLRGRRWPLRGHHELVDRERPGRSHDDARRWTGRDAGEPSLRRRVTRRPSRI